MIALDQKVNSIHSLYCKYDPLTSSPLFSFLASCVPLAFSSLPSRFKNIVRGGEFSDALLSLEENLDRVRQDTCVLHFGLATGGPRPYQDPRSHHWCLLRLRRLLGPAPSSGSGTEGVEKGGVGDAVRTELADLTNDILGAASAAAIMPHLIGRDGGLEEVVKDDPGPEGRAAARRTGLPGVGKAYWPRLSELRLSCGIMAGDLEGLAGCLGRWGGRELEGIRH